MSVETKAPPIWRFVFDVESMGLYGEGFAVGVVVQDAEGKEVDTLLEHCPYTETAEAALPPSDPRNRTEWIKANVVPAITTPPTCATHREVRGKFWNGE